MRTKNISHRNTEVQLNRTFILNIVYEYFSPLFLSWDKTKDLEQQVESLSRSRKALVVIQKANCFNQSALIQFTYLMADRHKALKDEYKSSPKHTLELEKKIQALVFFLNDDFHKIIFQNFEIMHSYFYKRSKVKPRICIKGNFKTHHKDMIISVFRDSKVAYDSDYDISEHTGFSFIADTGTYYLSNNLPKDAKEGRYKNPRLDIAKIKKVANSESGDKEISLNWGGFWKDDKKIMKEDSFYKSTLIIPMTLWNTELSEEFRKKINVSDIGRTIFGFLCIDHVEENYFGDDDVRVGYVFADLLSQYIFHRSVYTDFSTTFSNALEVMNSPIELVSEKTSQIQSKNAMFSQIDMEREIDLQKSEKNYLFGLDKKLMDYLGKQVEI